MSDPTANAEELVKLAKAELGRLDAEISQGEALNFVPYALRVEAGFLRDLLERAGVIEKKPEPKRRKRRDA